jgi:hypothetical protein
MSARLPEQIERQPAFSAFDCAMALDTPTLHFVIVPSLHHDARAQTNQTQYVITSDHVR